MSAQSACTRGKPRAIALDASCLLTTGVPHAWGRSVIDAIAYARKEGKEPTALAKAYVNAALAEKRYHAIFVFEGVWTEEDYEAFRKQTGAQPARALCMCASSSLALARACSSRRRSQA